MIYKNDDGNDDDNGDDNYQIESTEDADNKDEQACNVDVDKDDDDDSDNDEKVKDYQMASTEDADDEDEQARNVPLPLLPLAGVVIPQTRRLEHNF